MNDQIILNVTKRNGGLEVTTRGTGHDQLAAIEAVAASAWRVMTANRNVPPDAATGVILLSVQRGIQTAAGKSGHMNMEEIGLEPVDMSAAEGLPQWVILGAETGSRPDKVTPRREWVDQIAEFCAENEIPIFYKDNLRAYFSDLPPSAIPWGDQKGTTTEWAAHFMGRFERRV